MKAGRRATRSNDSTEGLNIVTVSRRIKACIYTGVWKRVRGKKNTEYYSRSLLTPLFSFLFSILCSFSSALSCSVLSQLLFSFLSILSNLVKLSLTSFLFLASVLLESGLCFLPCFCLC
jgi:hypothetical protein